MKQNFQKFIYSHIVIRQTKTNARSALTTVATMPTALTPKVHLTVVANQGTLEMATTVQVGPPKSFLYFL